MRPLPAVDTIPKYLPFSGGLDLVSQEALRGPGTLGDCLNYEPDVDGGYRRVGGYERLDGRQAPSRAVALPVACTLSSTPAAGAALTIGAVTATFIKLIDGGMLVANATGAVPGATSIVSGGAIGTTAADPFPAYEIGSALQAQWAVDAAAYYRTLIQVVPGSGPVRGVWMYGGDVYAFRNNAGATAVVMHRATSSGWSAVALGEEVAFTNANASVGEGDTLTQGGVTALVRRVVVETGSLASGVNTGRLILSGRAGGNYAAGAATTTGAGALTLSAAQAAITLPPGGRYRFRNHNFFGQSSFLRMYGVNGVGRAFEFDGTVMVPISTGLGAVLDTPAHIEVNRGYLWLATRSSVLYSAPGLPYVFDAAVFAGAIEVGSDVKALSVLPGQAVGVYTEQSIQIVIGKTAADFDLSIVAPESKCVSGIVGTLTRTYALDNRGLVAVEASQNYGNFAFDTVSKRVQPLINAIRALAVEAVTIPTKDQMRILLSDGRSVAIYPRPTRDGVRMEFTPLAYPMSPFCACCQLDPAGVERYLIGAADGYVYEMDRGSTFDGAAVEAFIRINYHDFGSPRTEKTFRSAVLELTAGLYANLSYYADFSYSQRGNSPASGTQEVGGTGSVWDASAWDTMLWDSPNVASPRLNINGGGTNISLLFYSNTRLDQGHAIQGVTVYFTPRRLQRSN